MKILKLDTWERFRLIDLIGSLRDPRTQNINFVRSCLRILDVVDLTEQELQEVGVFSVEVAEGASPRLGWQDKDREFELELEDGDLEFLYRLVTAYTGWEVSRLVDALVGKVEVCYNGTEKGSD